MDITDSSLQKESLEYLKKYDNKKYEQSKKRAEDLGLGTLFENAEVLVWGKTYYSTRLLKSYWKPEKYLYPALLLPIQYDLQGNGYMCFFSKEQSECDIVSSDGKWLVPNIKLAGTSKILSDPDIKNKSFTTSWYVGFGGNIYYYIAGEEYTFMKTTKGKTGGPTPEQFEKVKNKILKIVPGDIIQYSGEHIGTIAAVDYNAVEEAQSMIDLMKAVIVIEAVYNSRVNYVIKRNIMQGGTYCDDETETGSWLRKDTTNLRNFTIDRLLFN